MPLLEGAERSTCEVRTFTAMLVHSTKYDGSLHYQYPTQIVRSEPGLIVLYGPPGTPIHGYRGDYLATHHALEFYWADRDYNLHVLWHADWRPRMHYVNIATPASWEDDTLRFVDLDLDIIWRAASGEIVLDDEDEFAEHQARFGYPTDLIERCWRSCADVRNQIERRVAPFDGSLLAWRPNGAA